MDNILYHFERPKNEPVNTYAPNSPERELLREALNKVASEMADIPLIIGGQEVRTGETAKVVMPHKHSHTLGVYHMAGEKEVKMAIEASMKAHKEWSRLPWLERASLMLQNTGHLVEGVDEKPWIAWVWQEGRSRQDISYIIS